MSGIMQAQDDGSWRTQAFRQSVVSKLEAAIVSGGAPTNKPASEMENRVYLQANSKTEYLSFVAKLILHIKEIGNKKANQVQGQMGQGQGGMMNQMGQMNNMGAGNPMGQMGMNQMGGQGMMGVGQQQGGMNNMGQPQGMNNMGQPQGMNNIGQGGGVGMSQQQGMGLSSPQQQQQGGMHMNPQQGQMMGQVGGMMSQARIMAPNQQGMMGQNSGMVVQQQQGGLGGGVMNVNMGQQHGQMQSQGQMMNQNFMNQQQQMQMQGGGNQMGGMSNQQMQHLQNAQMQQALLQEQQQGGGSGVGRMRMSMQQPMQPMHRKGLMSRPMSPSAMGIPIATHGNSYPMNRLNYFASQQVDGGGMGQFHGGPGHMQRPYMTNSNPGMGMGGPSPSPSSMGVQMQNQSGFAHSPQPVHPHGSPGGMRPFGNQMVPSPGVNLNTPMPVAHTPSPRNHEEMACVKKIEELRRYTDMIQRMIVKIGNDDAEKSSKMKKLLDILLNPNHQVSMEVLLKCEIALKKMEKQQHETGPPSQPTVPPKDQISPFLQIQEAILTTLKNGSSSHTFLRTFRPSVEALTGQSSFCPDSPDEAEFETLEEKRPEFSPTLKRELRTLGSRFPVSIQRRGENLPLQIKAYIGDPKLPRVPFLKVILPLEYPEESPMLIDLNKDYGSTTFLRSIAHAFKSRMSFLPTKFTLYELLISWEMSVRESSNPISKRKSVKRLASLNSTKPTSGRLGLPFI